MIRIHPDEHRVREVPVADFLRRSLPEVPGIFVYYHTKTKNYVVAFWLRESDRIAQEIAILGESPHPTRKQVQDIIRDVREPVTWGEVQRKLDRRDGSTSDHLFGSADERDYWLHRWGKKTYSLPSLGF